MCAFTDPLNVVLEMVRLLGDASPTGTEARQIGFEMGWSFGPYSTTEINKEFDSVMAAVTYVNSLRAIQGLMPFGFAAGLESGRDACCREHMMLGQA